MDLRKRAFGLALGSVWGLAIFAVTVIDIARGKGETLNLLSYVYPGFSVTFLGAIIGLLYGLITGLIAGVMISWFYDLYLKVLYKSEGAAK